MCVQSPREWTKRLSLAEWWYNTSFHLVSQITPYKVLYNQPPPLPYLPGESNNAAVDRTMQRREQMIKQLQQTLLKSQQGMKQLADEGRPDRIFQINDWVWLKLQAYRRTVCSRGLMLSWDPSTLVLFRC